ncbi:MAG: hypothetical protein ACW98I_13760 [Candidatus Hodarchaeales archaeon]
MKLDRRRAIEHLIIGTVIFLVSQLVIMDAIVKSQSDNNHSLLEDEKPMDRLLLGNPLNIELYDSGSRYFLGTTNGKIYYTFVTLPEEPDRVHGIFRVHFDEMTAASIEQTTLYQFPLNENKSYMGIGTDGQYFWSLVNNQSRWLESQQLICFSRYSSTLVSNLTIEVENKTRMNNFREFYRMVMGFHKNQIILLEVAKDYTANDIEDEYRLLGYDLETQNIISAFYVPLVGVYGLFLDNDGIFWYMETTSSYGPYSFTGLDCSTGEQVMRIVGKRTFQRSYRPEDGEISPYPSPIILREPAIWLSEEVGKVKKVIFPLKYLQLGPSPDRFIGFRFYSFLSDISRSISQGVAALLWTVGTLISLVFLGNALMYFKTQIQQ